ncbi:hypothetical protein OAF44_02835 [Akkermansiaceae bacterium]|nr:hypothetical protein [Akkermansiaceae bacterium]MDB4546773.1 hypothetical protein [Akkermansiaceae bacterium]MDB4725438.1 hypothetical protein [Akkermansiaceae bacterium]
MTKRRKALVDLLVVVASCLIGSLIGLIVADIRDEWFTNYLIGTVQIFGILALVPATILTIFLRLKPTSAGHNSTNLLWLFNPLLAGIFFIASFIISQALVGV